jgi:hypothetical protein
MLLHVTLVRTNVLEESIASVLRAKTISEIGTTLAVTSKRSRMVWLLVTANVVPSSPILVTLIMEKIRSSEMSVLTKATRCNIPEDDILHSHRHENLKSYIPLTGWAL